MAQSVVSLPLDKVRIGPRLRAVDRDYVALLAASMAETGQHTPIHVGPADAEGFHPLIAGAHRCAAAAEAGLPTVLAMVFQGDALQQRMLEIDENLMRRELTQLDRAVFLAERQSLYLAIHPETGVGKAPKGKSDKNVVLPLPPAFTEETAGKLGLSRRSIERFLTRARIAEAARQHLAGTRWADHGATLDAIAKQPPELHVAIVQELFLREAESGNANVAAAIAKVQGIAAAAPRSETEDGFARLMTAWRKANAGARKQFLAHVLGADGPMRVLATEILEASDDGETRVMRALGGGRAA